MSSKLFTPEYLEKIQLRPVPHHVAIIPDGNRRWARKNKLSVPEGHHKGSDNIIEIVKAAKELGVKILTFYLFSKENWKRPQEEVDALMWLLEYFLTAKREEMIENNLKVQTIGKIHELPRSAIAIIEETKAATAHCNGVELVMALNYGSRDEICRTVGRIIQDCSQKKIRPEDITEELFANYLDTHKWPDPDLLIRTSGEQRVSNFLLWQISYAEIYVTEKYWPEFSPFNFFEALLDYQQRDRRLGGS